jgi:RNA polymerase sigma-70 factor (ECF subfamily)
VNEGATNNPVAEPEDCALMRGVGEGREDALACLIRRHQTPLLNFFARMGAHGDGEDLVQETFLRLYRYRHRYRPTARFTTFLYVLARHAWADRCRKVMRREKLTLRLQTEEEVAVRPGAPPGATMDVQEALNALSPKLKEVLVLNVYQGMRYQEIADVLGIPLGTVKSRINLAISAMRRLLE